MAMVPNKSSCSIPSFARPLLVAARSASFAPAPAATGLSETFSKLKLQKQVAFIPYITAGDPDLKTTAKALKILDRCGADVIELGVPHSDPVADGPVIQASARRALENGTTFDAIVSMLEEVVPQLSCPIALLSYYNPVQRIGQGRFISMIKDCGVHGLIVPDLCFEESVSLRKEAFNKNIEVVLLTTPTTSQHRMNAIADASEGFVYLVSTNGPTGIRSQVNSQVQFLLKQIKEATTKPVAVGFGISRPEHVRQLSRWGADGVIVGSAIVRLLGEAKSPEEGLRHVANFAKSLKAAALHQFHLDEGHFQTPIMQSPRFNYCLYRD